MHGYDQAREAADAIRSLAGSSPTVGFVLGSGLGGAADLHRDRVALPYEQLPHWPAARIAGHDGRVVVGRVRGRTVVALAGRCHLYEGYSAAAVTFGVRVLGVLGVRTVVLTNAAGGIRAGLVPGTLMVIDDHINLTGVNPLSGPNDERFGPRFLDLSEVYAGPLRAMADEAARSAAVPIAHGVYAALHGPSYETPAEVRYLRAIGADAVGMSTVPEAIAARHMGLDVLGLSCISNAAAGLGPRRLDHDDVMQMTRATVTSLGLVLEEVVGQL